jgi:hypothetical protein
MKDALGCYKFQSQRAHVLLTPEFRSSSKILQIIVFNSHELESGDINVLVCLIPRADPFRSKRPPTKPIAANGRPACELFNHAAKNG